MEQINNILFISINKYLQENKLPVPSLKCLDSDPAHFKLLQMQSQASFVFSEEAGPVAQNRALLQSKCEKALSLAQSRHVDLALFPEYCIPYPLIESLAHDKSKWPAYGSIWCLPCEAIKFDLFFESLDKIAQKADVIVLDKYCREPYISGNYFVNALFYCFIIWSKNKKKLVLIPQIKMHAMRDTSYLCESAGLALGRVLFYFEGQHICLLSIICADVFEKTITWEKLCEKTNCPHLIVLHPQLNPNPKEEVFCHLRHKMMEVHAASMYISCNWADKTLLFPSQAETKNMSPVSIHLSWSCIYQKFNSNVNWNQIWDNAELREENLKKGVCAGLFSKKRSMIWFSDSEESLRIERIAAPFPANYAIANQFDPLRVEKMYSWSADIENWKESTYKFSLKQKLESKKELSHMIEYFFPYWDIFPFDSGEKEKVDHFFALASCRRSNALEVDANSESPMAWSFLLDDTDTEHADDELSRFLELLQGLKHLPPHLVELKDNWQLTYIPPARDTPAANLCNKAGKTQRIIVAFAHYEGEAKRYLEYLRKEILPSEDGNENRSVCIFYKSPGQNCIKTLPRKQTSIIDGEEFKSDSSITDGGDDN